MQFSFVAIYVKSMEESLHFYSDILGLSIKTRYPISNGEIAILGIAGHAAIELLWIPENEHSTYTGFSIGIGVDSLDAAIDHLNENGHPVIRGPYAPTSEVRFAFIKDPNGVEIELIESLKQ